MEGRNIFHPKQILIVLIMLGFLFPCCKKETKLFRVIEHLEEKDIVESPLRDIYQKFEKFEQNLDGKWIQFPDLSDDKLSMWGITSQFPVLGLYEEDAPPGMKVFRDEREIEFLKNSENLSNGWKWIKGEKEISVRKPFFLNDVYQREFYLPHGPLFIEIQTRSEDPQNYLPHLKIQIGEEVVRETKIGTQMWYKAFARVDFGRRTIKLTFAGADKISPVEDEAMTLIIEKIKIKCLRDIILIACPKQETPQKEVYKAIYHTAPIELITKPSFRIGIEKPLLSYYYSIFRFKYDKKSMLFDSGIKNNPFNLKKKLVVVDQSINAILAPPHSEFEFELKIPKKTTLEFGYGILSKPKEIELNDVVFSVYIETASEKTLLFSKQMRFQNENTLKNNYQKIDLSNFKGKKAKISFVTDFSPVDEKKNAGNIKSNMAYWYNPIMHQKFEEKNLKKKQDINIILISIDTLRADHLGCYGYERDVSPNIDRLVKDSVLYANAFSHEPLTLPSHMSMLTGLYPVVHDVYVAGNKFDPKIITLSDVLREKGYHTAAITGGGMVSAAFGFSKGFDSYQEEIGGAQIDTADKLFEKASTWLDRHNDKKFFLFLHTYQTHSPYAPPEEFQMYLDSNPRWRDIRLFKALGGNISFLFNTLNKKDRQNLVDLYDGEIKFMDEFLIKPLIEKLKSLNLYDQSLIIFTSDHGEEFFEHQSWSHGYVLYNESIEVPLIIKFPFSEYKGRRIEQTARLVDIMPTVFDEAKIKFSDYPLNGLSLSVFLKKKKLDDSILLSEVTYLTDEYRRRFHIPGKIAVYANGYKLILNRRYSKEDVEFFNPPPPPLEDVELYNLREDDLESINLAAKETRIVRELLKEIESYSKLSRKGETDRDQVTINDELRERLRALGYIH